MILSSRVLNDVIECDSLKHRGHWDALDLVTVLVLPLQTY